MIKPDFGPKPGTRSAEPRTILKTKVLLGRDEDDFPVYLKVEITERGPEFVNNGNLARWPTTSNPKDGVSVIRRLSMSGYAWNAKKRDWQYGGQIDDTIRQELPKWRSLNMDRVVIDRLLGIWSRWHLNDMRAGCTHQTTAGWEQKRIEPSELPKSMANRDKKGILATWVYPLEHVGRPFVSAHEVHHDGLLSKRCPICRYEYGTKWLYEELPDEIVNELRELTTSSINRKGGSK